MSERPLVSVVMPAFNLAEFLPAALESAFAQRDVGGRIEIVVIDDGSTDRTPEILAGYGERIRTVRQPNGGLVSATSHGLRLAEGEFIALLDADDEWPADRLSRHLAALGANPALGLVHGDMEVIDRHGHVTHPSFFGRGEMQVHNGRVLGKLLGINYVTQSAVTFRASMLPAILPMPAAARYADWRICTSVAAVAEIGVAPGIASRYRQHGANMVLGAGKAGEAKIQRSEIEWRRWMLLNLAADETVPVADLPEALFRYHGGLKVAASGHPLGARAVIETDPAAAAEELSMSTRPGEPHSKRLLRALAHDPFDAAILTDLELALRHDAQLTPAPVPPPVSTLSTRSGVTLTSLEEILAAPAILTAFAEEISGDSDQSLVILQQPGEDVTPLVELVEAEPRLGDDSFDATVIVAPATEPAQAWLRSRADARLGLGAADGPYAGLPAHAAAERVERSIAGSTASVS